MVVGDLVFVACWKRTASGAISVNNAGGQTWNSFTTQASANATLSLNIFWCIFNGTWSANPSFTFNATTNNNALMVVFRPTSSQYTWCVDGAKTGVFTDTAAASSMTITGWTPQNSSNVNIAIACTDDDNTWTISGTGWIKTSLSAQYRNTSGNDTSLTLGYQIQTSAAATNNCVHTEATLGNDGGFTFAISFAELLSPSTFPEVKQPFFPAKTNVRLEKESVVGQPPPTVYEWVHRLIEQPFFGKRLVSASGQKNNALYQTQSVSDADAQAFIDYIGSNNAALNNDINDLVIAAKASGWWSKCVAIYAFVGGSSTAHAVNLKSPGLYSLVFNGAGWTHDANGSTSSSTDYADTQLNPLSVLAAITDSHYSVYVSNSPADGGIGVSDGSGNVMAIRNQGVNSKALLGLNTAVALAAGNGFWMGSRTANNNLDMVHNASIATDTGVDTGTFPNLNFYIGAENANGFPSYNNNGYRFATVGTGIDSALAGLMYTDIQNFQTARGRQV
jgi:hypothetical protein